MFPLPCHARGVKGNRSENKLLCELSSPELLSPFRTSSSFRSPLLFHIQIRGRQIFMINYNILSFYMHFVLFNLVLDMANITKDNWRRQNEKNFKNLVFLNSLVAYARGLNAANGLCLSYKRLYTSLVFHFSFCLCSCR